MKIARAAVASWCALGLSIGCVSTQTTVRPLPPDLRIGTLAHATAFEQDAPPAKAPQRQSRAVDDDLPDEGNRGRGRVIAFWTGVGMLTAGTAGLIGFGAAGAAFENKLANGYRDGGLTHAEEQRYQDNGELMNNLAIGATVLALAGLVTGAVALGLDYTNCGRLVKRKNCPKTATKD